MSEKNKFTIKHTVPTYQSDKTFDYLTHTQKLEEIIRTPWQRCSASSLAGVRKKVGYDLVDDPGMPEMVFTKSEVVAAELRAELMKEKYEDLVVTLVVKVQHSNPAGTIRVETLRYSQLNNRIADMKQLAEKNNGHVFVVSAYSEETNQEFWWNDIELKTKPRLPKYDQKYERKRTAYRTPADGVIKS